MLKNITFYVLTIGLFISRMFHSASRRGPSAGQLAEPVMRTDASAIAAHQPEPAGPAGWGPVRAFLENLHILCPSC